jgi:6-phosphogluconate dehydrogenase
MKEQRVAAATQYHRAPARYNGDRRELIAAVSHALLASKICSYAQGMSLIAAGAREWNWTIHLREIARIWKGGCIIRALLLDPIMQAFERQPALPNLLLDFGLQTQISASTPAWRKVVGTAAALGIPAPAFSASLAYFDAFTAAQLPQNLTQAQRDFFGAHTYQRVDRPDAGFVHMDWSALIQRSQG